jgi:hypothetical protein
LNELFCTPCFVSIEMYIVYIRLSGVIWTHKRFKGTDKIMNLAYNKIDYIPINCKKQVYHQWWISCLGETNSFIELSETDWNFVNELFCTPCFVSIEMYIVYIRLSAGIYITCKRGLTQPPFGACTKIAISFWQFYETVCFPKTADPSLVVNLFLAIYWNAIYFIVI